jgi:hypothetical protein
MGLSSFAAEAEIRVRKTADRFNKITFRRGIIRDAIRPELAASASVMESRLKENADRGDWRTLNFYYLVAALTSNGGQRIRSFQVDRPDIVLRSAADTANDAMMIVDLCGKLAKRKK